ncbi:cob(I)yrinic acid a,c-diamide adenosyltransferase [Propionivibrio sp.]|uniref:cob(I)yrinic acid a,c-diamide adenosyltransferase n=1 Tax=Propionivibrio sp. TaxID=2212460 RepID=UPI0025D604DC|nr:cob(I)yrinic acid a,c-diamide adenosyltransferase [Propionivibrio sp.]MBK7354901.1 cob(I)yrinic acid a,c-diamide adenosyltransferase [Propionivibrio sp.]MBK8402270.1 cob(I)yrinic acid a,c-diamide adenosyltransferase [Propionivibrio sp.]MBK8743428.1 cob(I)yrinic acid a,c-diamide adenosyltransferase [Propionivibrio sp.]MBK8892731.1 cob(I)yrinic acid a,c-diamide adenosyltransferase [Propionivibrio sp.]MBL0206615.1 cob(I)yrinic acid a,c-diamide adenosyltransferase [Propionivibrio sp.]
MTEHQGKEDRHNARMLRKKSIVDEKIAAAQVERGVLVINTGNGKGKSSSAFGVVARALGHDMKVAVIQFVKGRSDTGEEGFYRRMADSMPGSVRWHVTGEGFTWETQDSSRDAAAARAAWDLACAYLADSEINLVVLDEFTYALKYGWLDVAPVLAALAGRPPMQHVIITGRAAPDALIEAADTVTEMTLVKHAFKAGVKAMPGLEW